MRIVVSDSSCLIDLRKASLLAAFLELPYEVLIPNTLFDDELLKFTAAEKRSLLRGGLKVVEVPGTGVLRAREIIQKTPRLSINDGFAFAAFGASRGCRDSRKRYQAAGRTVPDATQWTVLQDQRPHQERDRVDTPRVARFARTVTVARSSGASAVQPRASTHQRAPRTPVSFATERMNRMRWSSGT